jgi:hypothetical protein
MELNGGGELIVNAICELRPGNWQASRGEVERGVLLMRPCRRRRRCCGESLILLAQATHPEHSSFTWGLWRCGRCGRSYSIGPRLPQGVWVSAIARICIELYRDYQAAVLAGRAAGE